MVLGSDDCQSSEGKTLDLLWVSLAVYLIFYFPVWVLQFSDVQ